MENIRAPERPKNTTGAHYETTEEYHPHKVKLDGVWNVEARDSKPNFKPQEELKMTQLNRTERKVTLIDNSAGLPAEKSLVFTTDIISDGDANELIQQVIMDNDIKSKIDIHNKISSQYGKLYVWSSSG